MNNNNIKKIERTYQIPSLIGLWYSRINNTYFRYSVEWQLQSQNKSLIRMRIDSLSFTIPNFFLRKIILLRVRLNVVYKRKAKLEY